MQHCIVQIYSLQLINAYISLQKTTNLIVKHIARSHFRLLMIKRTVAKKVPMEKLS